MAAGSTRARISWLIKVKRREEGLSVRAAANVCGLSPATLSRLESGSGDSVPDTETLTLVSRWLGVSPGYLMEGAEKESEPGREEYVPEVVEAHLRADKKLSSDTSKALAEMFRRMYDQFALLEEDKKKDSREALGGR